MTHHDTNTDELLVAYLLGRLDADSREDVEGRYLRDAAFHDELQAVEVELIDRYVHGELTGEDAHAFEQAYLQSPQRGRKVEFARQLMWSLSANASTASPAHAPSPPGVPTAVAQRAPALRWWGLALTTVALLVVTWLGSRINDERPEGAPDVPQQATGVSPQPAAPAPGVEREPPPASQPSAASPVRRVLTLMLLPTLTRANDAPPTLVIEDDTVDTELQLVLESAGDYGAYQVILRTTDDGEVWRQEGLTARPLPAGDAVVIRAPTALLRAEDYMLTVGGVSADGQIDALARYYFRVQRK